MADMTHPYTDLKEAAEKATPGPWSDGNEALFIGGPDTAHGRPWAGTVFAGTSRYCLVALTWAAEAEKTADLARYIALAHPARVLSLLDEIHRLREALERMADLPPGYADMNPDDLVLHISTIARAALKEKP